MNDVKITDRSDGSIELAVPHRPTLTLWAPEVAALREHFAAERTPLSVDAVRRVVRSTRALGYHVPDDLEIAEAIVREFAAEQPATPTPSTEQEARFAAAWNKFEMGLDYSTRNDTYLGFREGWAAAIVSPVSEQPTPERNPARELASYFDGEDAAQFELEQPAPLHPEPKHSPEDIAAEYMPWDGNDPAVISHMRGIIATAIREDRARYEQGGDR